MPRLFAAATLAVALLVAGCGDSDDGDADGSSDTSSGEGSDTSDSASSTTTTTTEVETGIDEGLVGQWTADGGDTLTANLSNLGGVPGGLVCSGPITLTFNADLTFTSEGTVTCSVGGVSVSASITSSGNWAVVGDGMVEISGTVSEGSFDLPGMELPPIDLVSDGEFEYAISGDTLTITFTDPNVGTVTQTWTRV